jgi:hypothetical protein
MQTYDISPKNNLKNRVRRENQKERSKKKKKTEKTIRWMGLSVVVVVRLGLLVAVRWLGCRIVRAEPEMENTR